MHSFHDKPECYLVKQLTMLSLDYCQPGVVNDHVNARVTLNSLYIKGQVDHLSPTLVPLQ